MAYKDSAANESCVPAIKIDRAVVHRVSRPLSAAINRSRPSSIGRAMAWAGGLSIRTDHGCLANATRRIESDGRGYIAERQPQGVDGLDQLFRLTGAPPEMVVCGHKSGMHIVWNDYQRRAICITSVDRRGEMERERLIPLPCSGPKSSLAQPNYDGIAGDWDASRLAGACALPKGHFAVAWSDYTNPNWPGGALRLCVYNKDGTLVHTKANVLCTDDCIDEGSSLALKRYAPMRHGTCRLVYGAGKLAIHTSNVMRWPGQPETQGGAVRYLQLNEDMSLSSARSHSDDYWLGSRSLDQRTSYDTYRGRFVHAFLADAYPRGVYLSNSERHGRTELLAAEGPAASPLDIELGGLVAQEHGTVVQICARREEGGSRNVALLFSSPDGLFIRRPMWLTDIASGEHAVDPKMADLGGGRLLVAWRVYSGSGAATAWICVVSQTGDVLMPAQRLNGAQWHRADDLAIGPGGRVYWATGSAEGGLNLHRLSLWSLASPQISY